MTYGHETPDPNQPDPLLRAMKLWNPWWSGAPFDHGLERDALARAKLWLTHTDVLVILGLRRCGKSTLMKQLVDLLLREHLARPEEILFINFEDPSFLELHDKQAPHRTLEVLFETYVQNLRPTGRPWLFLDEVQNLEAWAGWVRAISDTGRGRFVLSGSSSKLLEPELASKLTGRSIPLTLWPLSLREFCRFKGASRHLPPRPGELAAYLDNYLEQGGLPEVVLDPNIMRREERLKHLFRDILHRDVLARHAVRTVGALEQVAQHYLANSARESSYNSIKNRYGLAMDQVRAYTEHLVECYLIGTVPRFSFKQSTRDRAPQKVFARDLGMRNAVTFRFSQDHGARAETAVFNHLSREPDGQVFYFQDDSQKAECDFILWRGGGPVAAIQVCMSPEHDLPRREERGLLAAMEALELEQGLLLTGAEREVERDVGGRRIREVPLADWLYYGSEV